MMSIYDINYSNINTNLLPKQYRLPNFKALTNTLTYPIQWLRDIFFNNYVDSDDYIYTDLITLTFIGSSGTLVRFPDQSVWETQINGVDINLFNPIIGQTYDGDQVIWIKILDDSIGINERTKYSNQKIMFEYLLNRYFKHDLSTNYIYIGNNDTTTPMFEIGETDADTAIISEFASEASFYISEGSNENQPYNFTIYVPTLIASELGSSFELIVRTIADKYNYIGLNYNILTY